MTDDGPNMGDFHPSWISDGGGISGGEEREPNFDDYTDWDTNARTEGIDDDYDQTSSGDCTPPGGDTSKIYVKATHYVDGQWQCYWIDTTTC